ncbi:MAG TPA: thiamine-phosphate kinase [Candidatus Acidoferrales bacterium]|jgi:thiamine-monophosphate kinase|nr:thiamine-phosphate kinase [Candidatus Acidoferrales bacterium]
MASESQLIALIRKRFLSNRIKQGGRDGLRVGIGDDAAVLRPASGSEWVITTDAFLENVHFLRKIHEPFAVGYKALARATSDIAAMGARPRYFFLTLGLPESCTEKWFDGFSKGMARAAREFGLVLAGGDTTKYPEVMITLTVLGESKRERAILRSGAKPGDLLCVSGRLGEAELGLRLIQQIAKNQKRWPRLVQKHFYPQPRLALGEWLASHRYASSMIDTSDGLSTDLNHICKASEVGARVWSEKIPVVDLPAELSSLKLSALDLALHGGEDYELLFTVPEKFSSRLPRKLGQVPVTVIGEITREKKVLLVGTDGGTKPLKPLGWDSFRKQI